ncbi:apolipoprotein N-acyltransferase [Pseudosulfitobacter koreensis]|uniref:Apolipoprotein N-acyltransferase n=1 Tax=Pseudosulfitobacter koreensis TaxID=2968472 RepID=A0ABT1YZC8_9RHOB|nr:apolipoprotein N-acyltransferase [Pseudosulfitobacter koreense]MCR8826250.1 apolipoprotein N-acyltransferase [Pseudosulfitobacter koreense]
MMIAAWLAARTLWQWTLLAVSCGAVMALGQAPVDRPVPMLIALLVSFLLYRGAARAGRAGLVGFLIGFAYFILSLSWLTEPFQIDAARYGWMAPFALAGMAALLAAFWALAFALARRARAGVLGLALLWPLAELARGYLFTGFPWGMLPQGLLDTPAAQALAWVGPHGLMLVLCAGAAMMAQLMDRPLLVLPPAVAALASVLWPMTLPAPQMTPHLVRLVQPNAPQEEKFDPDSVPIFLNRMLNATEADPQPDLVVWPETAVPYLLEYAQPVFDQIAIAARGAPVVLGIQRRDLDWYYNSLVVVNADAEVTDIYDKHHLVPFGEYMPLTELAAKLGLRGLAEAAGGYGSGPGPRMIDLGDLGQALPLICYEAVFAQDVAAAPVRPAFLIQITNDAWFGQRAGPQQHLAQARMRAIEQGLPMARAANTGISAMIGPRGQILESLPLGVAGHVDAPLPVALNPTLYARTGDFPVLVLLLVGWGVLLARRISIDGLRRPT